MLISSPAQYKAIWLIIIASYEGIKAGLTNDLVYVASKNQIIAVHNGNASQKISIYNASDMSLVKTVTLSFNIYSMTYDSANNRYLVGVSSGYSYAYLDLDFNKTGEIALSKSFSNTRQGANLSDDGLSLILSGSNMAAWYSSNGTFIGSVALSMCSGSTQSICNIGDTYYILSSTSSGASCLYKATFTFDN